MITIDAAIEHSMERANKDCSECAKEHHQLAEWLIELKQLREERNKYQWHDLRKNPNDLPKEDGKYLCGDNRFEVIDKAKEALIESTNIEDSPKEMAVLDNFLFRCWQMGWLDKYGTEEQVQNE